MKIEVDMIVNQVDGCSYLKGRPKFLIVQACRGSTYLLLVSNLQLRFSFLAFYIHSLIFRRTFSSNFSATIFL